MNRLSDVRGARRLVNAIACILYPSSNGDRARTKKKEGTPFADTVFTCWNAPVLSVVAEPWVIVPIYRHRRFKRNLLIGNAVAVCIDQSSSGYDLIS